MQVKIDRYPYHVYYCVALYTCIFENIIWGDPNLIFFLSIFNSPLPYARMFLFRFQYWRFQTRSHFNKKKETCLIVVLILEFVYFL